MRVFRVHHVYHIGDPEVSVRGTTLYLDDKRVSGEWYPTQDLQEDGERGRCVAYDLLFGYLLQVQTQKNMPSLAEYLTEYDATHIPEIGGNGYYLLSRNLRQVQTQKKTPLSLAEYDFTHIPEIGVNGVDKLKKELHQAFEEERLRWEERH